MGLSVRRTARLRCLASLLAAIAAVAFLFHPLAVAADASFPRLNPDNDLSVTSIFHSRAGSAPDIVNSAQTPGADAGSAHIFLPKGARVYYVSSHGADTNDGRSPQTAWRTFAPVGPGGKVQAGAFVLAEAGGVWHEAVKAPADNVSFSVYGQGARPKIVAPDGQYAFDNQWHKATVLEGWELTAANRKAAMMGIVTMVGDRYAVRNVSVHGADPRLLFAQGNNGVIEDSEFYDCNGSGEDSAVTVFAHTDSTAPASTETHVIQHNSFHDTGYRALELHGTAFVAQNNTFTRWTAKTIGNTTQAPAGIYVTEAAPGSATVQGNTFNGTGVEWLALWVDMGPANVVFTGNTVSNCRNGGSSEKTNDTVFRGNTFSKISEIGIQWGDYPPEGPASVGGEITGNTFMGSAPKDGWVMIYKNGSSASVHDNTGA